DDIRLVSDLSGRDVYDESWQISFEHGTWVVGNGQESVVLAGVDRIQVGDVVYALVGGGGFAGIQDAIDAAADGDTICIAAGHYAENLILDAKAVHLRAAEGAAVTIDPVSGDALTLSGDFGA